MAGLALVTGGNRGIGYAIAKKLAESGYDVIIVGRDEKALENAKKELERSGVKSWAFACDLVNKEEISKLAEDVARIRTPDILVNNAGVAFNKEVMDNKDEEIEQMIDVNLKGLIYCTKEFLPRMIKKKASIIINISSGAGKTGFPGLAVYCATKFGVIGFTESLAQEVEGKGVRVYAICPGDTQTDMWESLYPGVKATYVPEDVAIEVVELIKNNRRIRPGRAIDVKKHV